MNASGMKVCCAFNIANWAQLPRHQTRRQDLGHSPGLWIPGPVHRTVAGESELAESFADAFINHIANCLSVAPLRQAAEHNLGHRTLALFTFAARLVVHHFG